MSNSFRLREKLQEFQRRKVDIVESLANQAVNFFKIDVWESEGFIDGGVKRWPKRKINKGKGRRLLVKTGRLRQSGRVISRTPGKRARVGFPVHYAGFHNEGTKDLPQRQFIGKSRTLDIRAMQLIKRKMQGLL